jgi:hypothetical protein
MVDSLRPVPVGACRCPGAPHEDGDVVSLDAELSTPAGIAAQAGLMSSDAWEDRYAAMLMGLVRHSVREWTFRDENGPIPITTENVARHLPWLRGGKEVAGAAAELYANTILTPFVEAFSMKKNGSPARPESHRGLGVESSAARGQPLALHRFRYCPPCAHRGACRRPTAGRRAPRGCRGGQAQESIGVAHARNVG